MAHLVKDSEGKIHSFPNEATPDQISKALNVKYTPKEDKGILDILKNKAISSWDKSGLIDPKRLVQAGLMGLGQAGQNVASTLTGGEAPTVNMQKIFGMENPSLPERLVSGASQYSPLIAVGPMGLLADTAAGAAYGTTQSPDSKLMGAGIGGGSNAAFNILEKMIKQKSPMARILYKALFGGSIGYELNGESGAVEGAIAAPIGAKLLKKYGFIGNPAEEIMASVKPNEAINRAKSAQRLGTAITPGEASGRPDITSEEASIGKVGEAAEERVKIGQRRINEQKTAINNLYKTISPTDEIASFKVRKAAQDSIAKMEKEREEAAEPFYKSAHKERVNPSSITDLEKSDKNISNAITEAMNDHKYQVEGELLGEPKNGVKVLDYAKRNLDSKIAQAKNFGDNDAVRVLTKSKNKLLDAISDFSPDYEHARKIYSDLSKPIEEVENSQVGQIARMKDVGLKNISKNIFDPSQTDLSVLRRIKEHVQKENPEAWDTIVRNEMNRLMTQGRRHGITGRSFFDNVLGNENRFKQFQVALEHNPEALQQLNDMRSAWEHLINLETPRTAAGQSKTSMNIARSSVQSIIDIYNNLLGGERHIKALNYLYSDKWINDLGKIKRLPKKEQKGMMSILLGKTIAPAYLLGDKE